MVALDVVQTTNRDLATTGKRPFVAVFVGGTAGIGEYGVRALAAVHGTATSSRGLRVYIVGRNKEAAARIVADCRTACPQGRFVFVAAKDLGLLRDVDRVCADITAQEADAAAKEGHAPQIDLAVMSQGVLYFGGREDTPEGLDHTMSLFYYSRARVVDRLLPLLTAGGPSSPGHVVFVANPSLESRLLVEDLGLDNPKNFGARSRGTQSAGLASFYCEAVAARHPGSLAAVHYYPGAVMTDIINTSPLPGWVKLLSRLLMPLILRFWAVPGDECGERVIFMADGAHYPALQTAATTATTTAIAGADGQPGPRSGAYRLNWNGESLKPNPKSVPQRAAGAADKVYEHTQAVFAAIAQTGKYPSK